MHDEQLFRAVMHRDLPSFTRMAFRTIEPGTPFHTNWHMHALWEKLRRVESGACRRLIVNVPPRSGKSIAASVAFPAWALGRNPALKIMSLSYGLDLARKHALDFRTVVEAPWYRAAFPGFGFDLERQRDLEITTGSKGYRMASSLGGRIHGRGADLIIIDDPMKPMEAMSDKLRRAANERYDQGIYSRLNHKSKGAIVIVMQRLHEDDLVGHVLAQGEDWDQLVVPAIAPEDQVYQLGAEPHDVYRRALGEILDPEREPQEALDNIRRTLGSLVFSAQYQQNPLPLEGNILKRDWLQFYEERPHSFDLVVASWDAAGTEGEQSDYSVGTVWGFHSGHIYLLDVIRGRYESPDLRRRIIETHQRYRATATVIEDSGFGRAVGQDLRRTTNLRPVMLPVKYDKQYRIIAQAPKIEAGQVLFPRHAPWLDAYLKELLGFPNSSHDDQVDSTSQALEYLSWRIGSGLPRQRPHLRRPQGLERTRPSRAQQAPTNALKRFMEEPE
jgi:predicted phage terminase large subunit-like protein